MTIHCDACMGLYSQHTLRCLQAYQCCLHCVVGLGRRAGAGAGLSTGLSTVAPVMCSMHLAHRWESCSCGSPKMHVWAATVPPACGCSIVLISHVAPFSIMCWLAGAVCWGVSSMRKYDTDRWNQESIIDARAQRNGTPASGEVYCHG